MQKNSKETIEVMRAALALAQRDVDLGLCSIDEIMAIPRTRFAPIERKKAVRALIDSGVTMRQAAKTLKVDRATVRRDLGKAGKRGGKAAKNGGKAASLDPVTEAKAEGGKTQFLLRADLAARSAVYSGKIDKETCRAARAAALAWDQLATKMERDDA